jgi:hypothetical protein
MLTDNIDTADLLDALPAFVKIVSAESKNPAEAFDCWATTPSGDDLADYGRGADNLDAAIRFAATFGATNFLSYVVGAIARKPALGAMEHGFLDALSTKAAVAPQIELDNEARSDADIQAGADLANIYLGTHDAGMIRTEIESLLGESGLTIGAMLHTFCRAALLGSKN